MQVTTAAVVPHAPLLLEGVGAADPTRSALRTAVAEISARLTSSEEAVLLLVSPHGERAGVYREARGSLDTTGVPGVEVSVPVADDVASALAGAWGVPILDGPLDHASVVALSLLGTGARVVVACLSEVSVGDGAQGPQAIDEGIAFAQALSTLNDSTAPTVTLVATAHSGAALSERGPLGKRWSALELEEHLRKTLESEPSRLKSVAFDLWLESGSCSPGLWAALGELATGPADVRAYDASTGVGYVVAEVPV